jgi:hypothetical protein
LDAEEVHAETTLKAERQSKMTDVETGWAHASSSEQDRMQSMRFLIPEPPVLLSWLLECVSWIAGSGRLLQSIDYLLQDVRAMVCDLLEDGVGKLLQLGIVPFAFFQLILKLQGKERWNQTQDSHPSPLS